LSGITGMPTVDNPTIPGLDKDPIAYPNGIRVPLPVGDVAQIPGAEVEDGDVLVPVVQPPTTNWAVAWVNWQVHQAMKRIRCYDKRFVWQYYRLKGVQGVPTSNEKAKDYYLANTVIESSQPGIQLFRGGISQDSDTGVLTNSRNQTNVVDEAQGGAAFSVGGCQGCHGVAQTQAGFDFSFLLGARAGVGFSPDTVGPPSVDEKADRITSYAQP